MSIIKYHNKKTGTVYVYESYTFKNKDTGKMVTRRKLIGKIDKDTGQIVATDGRCRHRSKDAGYFKFSPAENENGASNINTPRFQFGSIYLLDKIGEELCVTSQLGEFFPAIKDKILDIVRYLCVEPEKTFLKFDKWAESMQIPVDGQSGPEIAKEVIENLDSQSIAKFMVAQKKREPEKSHCFYELESALDERPHDFEPDMDEVAQLEWRQRNEVKARMANVVSGALVGQDNDLVAGFKDLGTPIGKPSDLARLEKEMIGAGYGKPIFVLWGKLDSEEDLAALLSSGVNFIIDTPIRQGAVLEALEGGALEELRSQSWARVAANADDGGDELADSQSSGSGSGSSSSSNSNSIAKRQSLGGAAIELGDEDVLAELEKSPQGQDCQARLVLDGIWDISEEGKDASRKLARRARKKRKSNIHVHVRHDPELERAEAEDFDKAISDAKKELSGWRRDMREKPFYKKYFKPYDGADGKKGRKPETDEAKVAKAKSLFGFRAAITNLDSSSREIEKILATREFLRKIHIATIARFVNKNLDISLEKDREAVLFVNHLVSLLSGYVRAKLEQSGLASKYSNVGELYNTLNIARADTRRARSDQLEEIKEIKSEIYEAMKIDAPDPI